MTRVLRTNGADSLAGVLVAGIVVVFAGRALLPPDLAVPHTFHVFDLLTALAAVAVVLRGHAVLRPADWLAAVVLGLVIGLGTLAATLFSPYPFLGLVAGQAGQAVVRGLLTATATLGGLAIMRQGGPVRFHAPSGRWHLAGRGVLVGLIVGLPLAVVNVLALQVTQGRPIAWQGPVAALLDALQPGIVEEVVYRFALWGLLWLVLRRRLPGRAPWVAGLVAMLVHTYSHYDELFRQAPLAALGMGAVMALIWGLPLVLLARRRGLESAMAFHWLQDVARFLAGY
jgi:hypothetical protein